MNLTVVSWNAGVLQLVGVGPDGVLQHGGADVVPVDGVEVAGLVQLAGGRVLGLEHLGVLVVDHRLGGVDVPAEQGLHVELLLDQGDVLARVQARLGHARRTARTRCRSPSCPPSCP